MLKLYVNTGCFNNLEKKVKCYLKRKNDDLWVGDTCSLQIVMFTVIGGFVWH